MEKLLQAAQAHLEKVSSQSKQSEKAKAAAKHQTSVHSALRVLPKDYPVRLLNTVVFCVGYYDAR